MATIETKYSIGDVVYFATTTKERRRHACPDCLGSEKWSVTSPAGTEYSIACPRCTRGYLADRDLSLDYTVYAPVVTRLTIGSVQFNSAAGSYDSGTRYMCTETGVGSGSIYDEDRLFETEEGAHAAATVIAARDNANTGWVAKLYDRSLEISDYQLSDAKIQLAKRAEAVSSMMLWNINSLFGSIEDADDKDAILELINDYKNYDYPRDLEKVREVIGVQPSSDALLSARSEEGAA
jgi:hypothetical protein